MADSPRYTVRFPPALSDALAAAVRQGQTVSDILRTALERYLASPQPLTSSDVVSDSTPLLSDMLSDIRHLQTRLADLEQRVERLTTSVRQRPTRQTRRPSPPPPRASPDIDAAVQRMRVLQHQGFSLRDIATQLDREGFRTKQGRPWHKSTVSYVLRTHGRS